MSFTLVDRQGRRLAVLSGDTLGTWAVQLASVLAMTLALVAAAPEVAVWPAAFLLGTAAVAMAAPDSSMGSLVLIGYAAWWLAVVRDPPWPWVTVAAVAGLAFHLALAHAASAPMGAVSSPAVVLSLLAGGTVVALGTSLVAILLAVITRSGTHTPSVLVGVALLGTTLIPWLASGTRGR